MLRVCTFIRAGSTDLMHSHGFYFTVMWDYDEMMAFNFREYRFKVTLGMLDYKLFRIFTGIDAGSKIRGTPQ